MRSCKGMISSSQAIAATARNSRSLARVPVRRTHLAGVMLRQWLEVEQPKVLPKGLIGLAIAYTLRNWQALTCYPTDGLLDIDNNVAERTLRHIALGRKNGLFAGSAHGANAAATLFSVTSFRHRFRLAVRCRTISPDDALRPAQRSVRGAGHGRLLRLLLSDRRPGEDRDRGDEHHFHPQPDRDAADARHRSRRAGAHRPPPCRGPPRSRPALPLEWIRRRLALHVCYSARLRLPARLPRVAIPYRGPSRR